MTLMLSAKLFSLGDEYKHIGIWASGHVVPIFHNTLGCVDGSQTIGPFTTSSMHPISYIIRLLIGLPEMMDAKTQEGLLLPFDHIDGCFQCLYWRTSSKQNYHSQVILNPAGCLAAKLQLQSIRENDTLVRLLYLFISATFNFCYNTLVHYCWRPLVRRMEHYRYV